VDILPERLSRQHAMIVNFKGFVGNWKNNTGEDKGYYRGQCDESEDRAHERGAFSRRGIYKDWMNPFT